VTTEARFLGSVRSVGVLILLFGGFYFAPSVNQLYQSVHLFDEDRIAHNFLNMDEIFAVRAMSTSDKPYKFRRASIELPETFLFNGEERNLEEYLDYSKSTGMIVLKDDVVMSERYWQGHHEDGHHISWSVAKSFVSALVGIAVRDGLIANIDEPITRYLPQLAGSGYEGVPIRHILEMSSGVEFNEDYADFDSDINRFSRTIAFGGSMARFAQTLRSGRPSGTYHHYVSIDTQVLGMLLVEVTGMNLSSYLEAKIWRRIGMEHSAHWLLDSTGMEVALGGLNASLRDYARFGLLYLNEGRFRGEQIIPRRWIRDSTTPGAPRLVPGKDNPASSSTWGYGYQWWVPDPAAGDFTAAGVYNQYIYVNPEARVVIVKTSANRRYLVERQESKDLHIAMFRAIASALADPK
jgi:CubicO group peptidase (beta-lactamase class C family)